MRNHTRSSQGSLAALLLTGLSAACMSDPLAGTSLPNDASANPGGGTVATGGVTGPAGGTTSPAAGGTTSPAVGGVTSAAGGVTSAAAGTTTTSGGARSPAGGVTSASEAVTNAVDIFPLTSFTVLVSREVDILFMIDNSPSMDPKQQALAANFPKMIQVLQNLPDPSNPGQTSLPDVHIGVISSDMGAGSDNIGGNCSRVLGDRGLLWGNDPNNLIASVAPGNTLYSTAPGQISTYPTPNGCGLNSGARWISDVANANGVGRAQNYTGQLTDVFTCLAQSVGIAGCGYEHQLQSIRVALNPQQVCNALGNDCTDVNMENVGFLRPEAYLAIVLITDEDDCSAPVADVAQNGNNNDGMFLTRPPGETASLKCAARGHLCGGQPIPGYDPVNGFTPQNSAPTPNVGPGTGALGFMHPFSDCTDKEQLDRNNLDSTYLPLIDVRDIIDSVNGVKGNPQTQILVSGIFGWPPDTALPNVQTTDQYRIGVDTTSLPAPENTYWDYMPICWNPTVQASDGNIYKAYGGLRHNKFVSAFGANGQRFSICNQDFTDAMTQIGTAISQALSPGCVQYPLIDTNPNAPGVQPECQVVYDSGCTTPGQNGCLTTGYSQETLTECIDPTTQLPLDPTNPLLANVPDSARPCWYLYYDADRTTGCPNAFMNQRITVLRPSTAPLAPPGTLLALTCLTCPASDQICPALGSGS